ncbi:hypothetical protein [Pseudocolwellia agarivorans]|uniref:hypothetical protein n=1 Tax=Pseudocolwellia agarivorans TaxID=1911682 RepID=UPI003F88239D
MKTFLCRAFWLLAVSISIGVSAEEQKVYEVNNNRELSRSESIAPTFYQEYGPYLFFLSKPEYDPQCCSPFRAYGSNTLWRLDSTDNSVQLVGSDFGASTWEQTTSYAVVNNRIISFSVDSLISSDLSGLDKKSLGSLNGKFYNEPHQMVRYSNYVYFTIDDELSGKHILWRTDGTVEGTSKVSLCMESSCYEAPRKLIVSGNKLFFIATSNDNTNVILSVSNDNEPVVFSGATVSFSEEIFPVSSGIQFNSTNQLWFTDGTSTGSYPINVVNNGSQLTARESIDFGDLVVTAADEIYVISDKGKGATTLIDVDPRVENGFEYTSFPSNLTVLNNKVYFIGKFYNEIQTQYISKLMATDGTPEGIHEIFQFSLSNNEEYKIIGAKGNKLIILRHVPDSGNNISVINEIWVSDGTTEGTIKLTDNGVRNELWDFEAWHFLENDFYFSGYTQEHGIELWRTDGSVSGTLLAKDIGYGQTKVQKGPIATNVDDVFYMMERQWYGQLGGINGYHTEKELWKTDVLTMRSSKVTQWTFPTRILKQIITVEGGQYWWIQNDTQSDLYDLAFYDYQNEDITIVVTDMLEQCVGSEFTNRKMVTLGKEYYFQAPVFNDDSFNCQLWVSDGTIDGTKAVTNLPRTAALDEIINNIVTYQNEVYFSLVVEIDEYLPLRTAIFKTDGTVSGTSEVFRLSDNGEDNLFFVENMLATSQGIYLVTNYGSTNLWYWQSKGITKVVDNADDFSIWSLTRFKEGISFVSDNAIWSSDGTESGTSPIIFLANIEGKNNYIDKLHSTPDYEKLIYGSYDSEGNHRLWVSDGTSFGTSVKGPIIDDNNFIVNAFSGNDFYVTDYSGTYEEHLYQDLKRISLEDDVVELIMQRQDHNENFPASIVEAQGRVFVGQEHEGLSFYGPGFGGPYVTVKLNNDDFDNDGFMDIEDAFPLHPDEYQDTDRDNVGNNFDNDDDNDGIVDQLDLFPLDATEWADNDSDGLGDTLDLDDDNDGVTDWLDSYPKDSSRTSNDNTNGSGTGNSPGTGDDGVSEPTPDGNSSGGDGGGSTNVFVLLFLLVTIIPRMVIKR